MGDNCETTRSLNEAKARDYYGNQQANIGSTLGEYAGQTGRRLMAKGEEAQEALRHVLAGTNRGLSITALERAVATVKAHLEADA